MHKYGWHKLCISDNVKIILLHTCFAACRSGSSSSLPQRGAHQIGFQSIVGIHPSFAIYMTVVTLHSAHADKQQSGNVLNGIALGIVAQDNALRGGKSL